MAVTLTNQLGVACRKWRGGTNEGSSLQYWYNHEQEETRFSESLSSDITSRDGMIIISGGGITAVITGNFRI